MTAFALSCTLYRGIYHILRTCNFSHVLVYNYLPSFSFSFYLFVGTNKYVYICGFAHLCIHMWKSEVSMPCVFLESFPHYSLRHCHSEDLEFTIKDRLSGKKMPRICMPPPSPISAGITDSYQHSCYVCWSFSVGPHALQKAHYSVSDLLHSLPSL